MKAILRLAADREHRTLSNMIEYLLLEYCERHAIPCPARDDEPAYSPRNTSNNP